MCCIDKVLTTEHDDVIRINIWFGNSTDDGNKNAISTWFSVFTLNAISDVCSLFVRQSSPATQECARERE